METSNTSRFLSRFTAACLLVGFLFFGGGAQASMLACRSMQQVEAGCCADTDSAPGCGEHVCCTAKTVAPTAPARLSGSDYFTGILPCESGSTVVLPTTAEPTRSIAPPKPVLLFSFAELVLQESLLSHAPPVEVL